MFEPEFIGNVIQEFYRGMIKYKINFRCPFEDAYEYQYRISNLSSDRHSFSVGLLHNPMFHRGAAAQDHKEQIQPV